MFNLRIIRDKMDKMSFLACLLFANLLIYQVSALPKQNLPEDSVEQAPKESTNGNTRLVRVYDEDRLLNRLYNELMNFLITELDAKNNHHRKKVLTDKQFMKKIIKGVQNVPSSKETPEDDDICSICREDLNEHNGQLIRFPCKHEFHVECARLYAQRVSSYELGNKQNQQVTDTSF